MARRNRALDDLVDGLARVQHGAFTLAQVEGVADRRTVADRVEEGSWQRFARATFVHPRWRDEWTTAAALCLHVPTAAVTGPAAGRWWALDGIPSTTAADRLRITDPTRTWEVRLEPNGCLDLAWPELMVAIELDGDHHREKTQLQRDDRKQNAAVLWGWTVLRFTWDRIADEPERVVAEIVAALAAARSRRI